jgi:UDP-N-acetylglucosamine--N-acetylmuramyl-(pentapeptide) pyrophosphoryl-undecaprenol N-acetylglucosamine transferase
VPAILVPLPGAPGDHQTVNAQRLVDAGAAVMVADADLDAQRLSADLERLLDDPEALEQMSSAGRSLSFPDAAQSVAALAEENARA